MTISKSSVLKLKRPLAVIDLETTGKTPGLDRIIEVGILKVSPDGRELPFQTRVNPEMRIPPEASDIHGIADKDVRDKPTFRKIAPQISRFIEGCDLAGYNLSNFDLPMLNAEFERVGMPLRLSRRRIVDAMSIYFQKEPRDLRTAHKFYCGGNYDHAHSAFDDARACWHVLQGQLRMYEDLPKTPEGLSRFISDYKQGKTLDSGGWFEMRYRRPAFARGKYQGHLIREVEEIDPDYLDWLLKLGPPSDTIDVIRSVLPNFGK